MTIYCIGKTKFVKCVRNTKVAGLGEMFLQRNFIYIVSPIVVLESTDCKKKSCYILFLFGVTKEKDDQYGDDRKKAKYTYCIEIFFLHPSVAP